MATTDMLRQIFLSSERSSIAPIAVRILTIQFSPRRVVLLVNFPLVAKQPPRIRKPLDLVTTDFLALVRSLMLVHVLAEKLVSMTFIRIGIVNSLPLARPAKDRNVLCTF